jgi:hypothetical protein
MESSEIKKAQAIAMMIEGHTQAHIADQLSVDPRTIRRWSKEPAFAAALKEERECAITLATAHAAAAVMTDIEQGQVSKRLLVKIRDNPDASLTTRMRAAGILMSQAFKATALLLKQENARKKADKSGHSVAETPENGAESGQNRTKADNPNAAIEEMRSMALKECDEEMAKLDQLEQTGKDALKRGADAQQVDKYLDEIELAKQSIDGVIGTLENASPEELKETLEKNGGKCLFELNIPKIELKAA